MIWLHMKHCSIGKVHAPKAQEHEYVLQRSSLVWLGPPTRTMWCFWCGESIPAFVYPMLGGGQHAVWDQMKLIGKPNYHLTEHPATPFLVYTHFRRRVILQTSCMGMDNSQVTVVLHCSQSPINFLSSFRSYGVQKLVLGGPKNWILCPAPPFEFWAGGHQRWLARRSIEESSFVF